MPLTRHRLFLFSSAAEQMVLLALRFLLSNRHGTAANLEHGIEELEHRTLIGVRKLFDALEALEGAPGCGR